MKLTRFPLLLLFLAGCGGGGGYSAAPPPAPPAPPAAVAPTITSGPASQSVAVGSSVTFSVVGTGTAPLTYQWQRNGSDVAGATAASLVLPATVLGDTRTTWHAVVRNSAGSATSGDATLSVSGIAVVAGTPAANGGFVDASGAAVSIGIVSGMTLDATGTLVAADIYNNIVRTITPAGIIGALPGSYAMPSAVATDAAGNLYVAEAGNGGHIGKRTPSGATTVLGVVTPCGSRNAPLYFPSGLAPDGAGGVYVANSVSLRHITAAGAVNFLSGDDSCNPFGNTTVYQPTGIVLDSAGNLYVASGLTIKKITPAGVSSQFTTGFGEQPRAMLIDAQGNIYVPDNTDSVVRKITPAGVVSVIAGVVGSAATKLGALPGGLQAPNSIAIDKFGDLYVQSGAAIVKIQFP